MKTLAELSDSEAVEIFLAHRRGELEYRNNDNSVWYSKEQDEPLYSFTTYRIAPKQPITVDWSHLHEKWHHVARDDDGGVYAYKANPVFIDGSWIANGQRLLSGLFASLDPGTVDACDSLICRP